jgi:hypothetical protein
MTIRYMFWKFCLTKGGSQRGIEMKRGESGSSCMPEDAWQKPRDTGLRHLSVGVVLYDG